MTAPAWLHLACLSLVVSVAVATRFWRLGADNLWLDEIWSLEAAQMSFGDMVKWTSADIHPPLYYALLHPWIDIFGTSEAGIRSLSAAAGVLTIVVLFVAARRAGSLLLATSAALFLAFNPAFLAVSQEARMYAVAGFLALASAVALAFALERRSMVGFLTYGLFASALIYTHYIGFFVLALLTPVWIAYAMSDEPRRNTRLLVYGAGASLLIAAAYIPWLDDLMDQASRDHSWEGHFPDPSAYTFLSTFRAALGFQFLGGAWVILALPLLVLAGSFVVRHRRNPYCLTLAALAVVPLTQVVVAVLYQPLFDLKRVAPFTPGFAFLIGCAVVQLQHVLDFSLGSFSTNVKFKASIAAPLSAVGLLVLVGGFDLRDQYDAVPPERWRLVAESIARDQQSTYVYRGYIDRYLHYYMDPDQPVVPIDSRVLPLLSDGFVPIPRAGIYPVSIVFAKSTDIDGRAIQKSLQPFFDIQPEGDYGTVTRLILTPKSIAQYNVSLSSSDGWSANSDGYLITVSGAPLEIADEDEDASVAMTLVIESRAGVSVSGIGDGETTSLLQTERRLDDGWIESSFALPRGQRSFRVSRGAVIRVLEARRYETKGAAILRGEAPVARQWFLRPDGHLEIAVANPCVLLSDEATSVTFVTKTFGGWQDETYERTSARNVECFPQLHAGTVVRSITGQSQLSGAQREGGGEN